MDTPPRCIPREQSLTCDEVAHDLDPVWILHPVVSHVTKVAPGEEEQQGQHQGCCILPGELDTRTKFKVSKRARPFRKSVNLTAISLPMSNAPSF